MGVLLFLVAAWAMQTRDETGCPSCIRWQIARFAGLNLITANLLWPVLILPVALFHLARSFTPGHTKRIFRQPDLLVPENFIPSTPVPAMADESSANPALSGEAGAGGWIWLWSGLLLSLTIGGGVFALLRVMQSETEGFRALFVSAAPVAGALAALGLTVLLRNSSGGRPFLLGCVGLVVFIITGLAPWIFLVWQIDKLVN